MYATLCAFLSIGPKRSRDSICFWGEKTNGGLRVRSPSSKQHWQQVCIPGPNPPASAAPTPPPKCVSEPCCFHKQHHSHREWHHGRLSLALPCLCHPQQCARWNSGRGREAQSTAATGNARNARKAAVISWESPGGWKQWWDNFRTGKSQGNQDGKWHVWRQ